MAGFSGAGHRPIVLAGGATGTSATHAIPANDYEHRRHRADWVGRSGGSWRDVDFDTSATGAVINNMDWTSQSVGKSTSCATSVSTSSTSCSTETPSSGSTATVPPTPTSATCSSGQRLRVAPAVRLLVADRRVLPPWGNIIAAGVRLVRQKLGATVHALTVHWSQTRRCEAWQVHRRRQCSLWLDHDQPIRLVPVLFNTADADVIRYLRWFTFLTEDEVDRARRGYERPGRTNGWRNGDWPGVHHAGPW